MHVAAFAGKNSFNLVVYLVKINIKFKALARILSLLTLA